VKRYFIYIIFAVGVCVVSCAAPVKSGSSAGELQQQVRQAAGTSLLNIPAWQYQNYAKPDVPNKIYGHEVINQTLLREQIIQVLKENHLEIIPAVRFRLEDPPYLLVVSPRAKIEYADRELLTPGINPAEMAAIESKIDSLNYSSLVVGIGGLGAAYPAIVSPEMDTRHIINAAVEEWAHQFLALRPLGSLYLLDCLGFRQSPETIVMNECLAGIIADEIGDQVYDRYYKRAGQAEVKPAGGTFDFASEMRSTRRNVDILLNVGEIAAAEQYMEKRRVVFEQNGYRIRKLNQAYFAFHGLYGDDPGAVSPVYTGLTSLRHRYTTLSGFVNDASAMTGYDQLKEALPQ
jgi:hypothetical protein